MENMGEKNEHPVGKIKTTVIAKVDKDVEKQELSYIAGESIKWQISVEKD